MGGAKDILTTYDQTISQTVFGTEHHLYILQHQQCFKILSLFLDELWQ